jgi:hypothetical protein
MLAVRNCDGYEDYYFLESVFLFFSFSGIPLFCSKDPHHHLKLLIELRGPFSDMFLSRTPKKQKEIYYDESNNLLEKIEVAPNEVCFTIRIFFLLFCFFFLLLWVLISQFQFQPATLSQNHRDIHSEIRITNPHTTEQEKDHIAELCQMIMDCTELDPQRRIRASSCLANKLFC